jgi:hypothetical protein
MKTLLIIIFLAIQIQGICQSDSLPLKNNEDYYYLKPPEKVYISEPYKKAFIQLITDEWQEYEQECFNDSVYDCSYEFIEDCIWLGHTVGHEEYKCKWIHKQPTAEEFLDWIIEKWNIKLKP